MVKIIGLIIILFSCSKIGIDASRRYKSRSREIRSLITALELMKSEISFTNSVVSDVLASSSSVSSYSVKEMLGSISDSVANGNMTVYEAYKKYIKENSWRFSLKKAELEILDVFFSKFGMYAPDDQIACIDSALKAMELNLKDAVFDERKYARLSAVTGIASGFLIAVIFI